MVCSTRRCARPVPSCWWASRGIRSGARYPRLRWAESLSSRCRTRPWQCCLTLAAARQLLEGLRGAELVRRACASAGADLDAVAALVARVGHLALAMGDDLESLEVNPLLIGPAGIEALDAVVTWAT